MLIKTAIAIKRNQKENKKTVCPRNSIETTSCINPQKTKVAIREIVTGKKCLSGLNIFFSQVISKNWIPIVPKRREIFSTQRSIKIIS